MIRLALLVAVGLAPLSALALSPTVAPVAPPEPAVIAHGIDDLKFEQPWVRLPPAGGKVTGGFVKIVNKSGVEHAIVKASSPIAKVVELHTHVEENGVFRMRPIERIVLPPHSTTELKPGGLHLMFFELKEPLSADGKVTFSLTLEDGSAGTLQVPVRAFEGMEKRP